MRARAPDREDLVDRKLGERAADLGMALLRIGAELGHLAEDGDRAAAVGERDQVLEAGAHRRRGSRSTRR